MTADDPWALIGEASYLPYGRARIEASERAIVAADHSGDLDAAFAAREQHVESCTFGGAVDRAVTSFAWCLAQHDADPDRFDGMLWEYKWIASSLASFAAVSRTLVEQTVADFSARYRAEGASEAAVLKIRYRTAEALGDQDDARRWFDAWVDERRSGTNGYLSDCEACDVNSHVTRMVRTGEYEEALRVAEPLIEERVTCHSVPATTWAHLLVPLAVTGRTDAADAATAAWYPKVRGNAHYFFTVAGHADYRRHAGRTGDALDIVLRHWAWAESGQDDLDLLYFWSVASRCLAAYLDAPRSRALRRVTLTPDLGVTSGNGVVDLTALLAAVDAEVGRIAGALDGRNGSTTFTDAIGRDPYRP